jgi:hypothetical protein
MRPRIPLAAAALLVALVPVPAAAQANADADTREVLAYRLTLPKLRQLNEVYADLQRQREADPAYQQLKKKKQELAALAEKEELSEADEERMARLEEEIAELEMEQEGEELDPEDQSLSRMVERMTADPRIAGALKKAGLAPREAVVLQLALLQAAVTAEMLDSGTIKEMPENVNAENVRFCRAHKAEIAALTALMDQEDQEQE